MAILAGALAPDAGTMRIDGRAYAPRNPIEARRAGVAMIYQELSLAPHLSVMENILLGAEPMRFGLVDRARDARDGRGRARAARPRRHPARRRRSASLSVAEQQLVEIARALAVGCRVLVLDEPTSSLGARRRRSACSRCSRRLKSQGHAIVYISHFIEEVKTITDRFVVLRDGRNAGGGVTADATPRRDRRADGRAARRAIFSAHAAPRGETRSSTSPTLEPGSATFTLHRGEILGIAGLVGSGRTRLLRTLFGLEAVKSGRHPHRRLQRRARAARAIAGAQGMGLLSEDRKSEGLALGLSVADNLTLTRLEPFGPARWSCPPGRRDGARRGSRGWRSVRRPVASRVASCPAATSRRSRIARLLHHDVDVLLLDEPTRGIDVGSKAQIYRLIDELVGGQRPTGPRKPC